MQAGRSGISGCTYEREAPAGAAIDATRRKRGAVVLVLILLAIGALVIFAIPTFWPVIVANTAIAVVGDVFGPAVAALTLGLYARRHLARRMGRNSAFDHAGKVAIAAAAGGIGYLFPQRAVFLLVLVLAILAAVAMLSIPRGTIDKNRAPGLDDDEGQEKNDGERPSGFAVLLKSRRLIVFALCAMLFNSPTHHCCRWSAKSLRRPNLGSMPGDIPAGQLSRKIHVGDQSAVISALFIKHLHGFFAATCHRYREASLCKSFF